MRRWPTQTLNWYVFYQIRQFLSETLSYMDQMIRTVNIKEEILVTIEIIADFSYAWMIMDK